MYSKNTSATCDGVVVVCVDVAVDVKDEVAVDVNVVVKPKQRSNPGGHSRRV